MIVIGSRLCLLVASVSLAADSVFAQTTGTQLTAPAQNLSEKLNRSNGVIHPKEIDSAIEKPAPKAGDENVVPPPGAAGGVPAPQPK